MYKISTGASLDEIRTLCEAVKEEENEKAMKEIKYNGFSREIIDLICDDWGDDEQLVIDALVYLYNTTTDDKMIEQIEMVCKDYGYCPDCGTKLSTYEWCETHTELEYDNQEWFSRQLCPCCDSNEIEDYMEEEE